MLLLGGGGKEGRWALPIITAIFYPICNRLLTNMIEWQVYNVMIRNSNISFKIYLCHNLGCHYSYFFRGLNLLINVQLYAWRQISLVKAEYAEWKNNFFKNTFNSWHILFFLQFLFHNIGWGEMSDFPSSLCTWHWHFLLFSVPHV